MLCLLVLVGVCCLAVGDAANLLVASAHARAAADAAALAAAADQWPYLEQSRDPSGAASRMAELNGVRMDRCDCPLRGSEAIVTVSVATSVRILRSAPGRVHATARARGEPGSVFVRP
jgi:uncharacterized membrane protein